MSPTDYTPGAGGALTGIESATSAFSVGDVVTYEDDGLGIVTAVAGRGVTVVFANGGRMGGPGMLADLKHIEPRVNVPVPPGALGNRGWNRQQAVTAALRRIKAPGPESALSSLPSCPCLHDAPHGPAVRGGNGRLCMRPSKPAGGRTLVCTGRHVFAGTPAEHEQARRALSKETT